MKIRTIACLLTAPLIVAAEDSQQQLEVSLKFKSIYTDTDVANGLGSVNNVNTFLFVSQSDNGATLDEWGEALELNFDNLHHFTFADDDYSVGAAFGAELFESKVRSNKSLPIGPGATNGYVDTLPIDGSISPGAIFSFTGSGAAKNRYTVESRRIYTDVRVTKEINSNFRISGSLYSSLSKLTLESGVFDPNDDLNDNPDRITLDQRVDSYSLGPFIILQTNYQINEKMHVFLDTKAGILFSHGKVKANQESVGNVPGIYKTDDKSDDVAGFGSLECGLVFQINDSSAVSVSGGAEYRNDSYEIINPRSSDGIDANDPSSFGNKSSYIEQVDQINLYGGIEYTHRF